MDSKAKWAFYTLINILNETMNTSTGKNVGENRVLVNKIQISTLSEPSLSPAPYPQGEAVYLTDKMETGFSQKQMTSALLSLLTQNAPTD